MTSARDEMVRQVTTQLREETLWELGLAENEVAYRPAPDSGLAYGYGRHPVWRMRFDLTHTRQRFGLDVNGEVILGRGDDAPGFVSLDAYDADELGVSRRHAMLRPADTKLYIVDLGSTNRTSLNGRSIGVNTPYSLSNGDLLSLGRLELVVRIIKCPLGYTEFLKAKADLSDMLVPMARAITSQLDVDEVLKRALEMTVSLASVDEATIWLVDEQTGELFLEAEQGIQDEEIRRMRLPVSDSLAGKVIETGQPLRANRQAGEDPIKLKTGYLVDAVIYVPLKLGGVTFGVLSAVHRQDAKSFSQQEEKLMTAMADFAAIAVQNARLFQATDHALTRRVKVVTALNYTLSYDLKNLLHAMIGYAGLLGSFGPLDEDMADIVARLQETGNHVDSLLEQLIEITALCERPILKHAPCDLIELTSRAVGDLRGAAVAKATDLDFQVMGDPYVIRGDAAHLYRSVFNLVDNAIRYSPPGAKVTVTLVFANDVIIRVQDTGPGIPEDDLPYIFDKYFRGRQSFDGQAGLGLGLEFVRATVETHQGTVMARNAEGQGAEFIITLPGILRVAEASR